MQTEQLPDEAILVYIRGSSDSLFSCLHLLGNLTLFGEKDEGKHIYHLYPDTCLNLAFFHYYAYSHAGVLISLVLLYHSHYF